VIVSSHLTSVFLLLLACYFLLIFVFWLFFSVSLPFSCIFFCCCIDLRRIKSNIKWLRYVMQNLSRFNEFFCVFLLSYLVLHFPVSRAHACVWFSIFHIVVNFSFSCICAPYVVGRPTWLEDVPHCPSYKLPCANCLQTSEVYTFCFKIIKTLALPWRFPDIFCNIVVWGIFHTVIVKCNDNTITIEYHAIQWRVP